MTAPTPLDQDALAADAGVPVEFDADHAYAKEHPMSETEIPIPSWEPGVYPTPAQWVEWFDRCPQDHRLIVALRVIDDSARAARCFEMNHEKHIAELERRLSEAPR